VEKIESRAPFEEPEGDCEDNEQHERDGDKADYQGCPQGI